MTDTTDQMPPHAEAAKRLSCEMQQLTTALKECLCNIAGANVEFILLTHTDDVLQYVSTIDRQQSMEILTELLTRWAAGKPDIPAHYNPDLQ